jgi:hypothetical protein
MSNTVYIIAEIVNALLKSRVRENRKHGCVRVIMAMKLKLEK